MQERPSIRLSAEALSAGRVPDHCSQHGLPAVRRKDFAIPSRPAITTSHWSNLTKGMNARLWEWMQKVKHVRVRGWPLCQRCLNARMPWMPLAMLMFWGGAAWIVGLVVAGLATAVSEAFFSYTFFAAFGVMIGAVLPGVRGGYQRIIRAHASDDGTAVVVESPHPVFVAEAAPLLVDSRT